MISLKKAIFALAAGIGLSASLNAWARPDCETCEYTRIDCEAGIPQSCDTYNRLCKTYYPPGSCSIEF